MKVIEIVIDGFKSYAVRTVISGWDESFNSITGLNGSGKSNILDAICFVLGITSMSTVRAQNIQVSFEIPELRDKSNSNSNNNKKGRKSSARTRGVVFGLEKKGGEMKAQC
jgi:chromosome segregation ATPase